MSCSRTCSSVTFPLGAELTLAKLADVVMATAKDALGLSEIRGNLQEPLGLDQPLMDAGLDSSLAVQFTTQLQARLQMDLPGTLVFDYPSVNAIITFLAACLSDHPSATSTVIDAASGSSDSAAAAADTTAAAALATAGDQAKLLEDMILQQVAEVLDSNDFDSNDFDSSTPLMESGVTSAAAVELTSALERALACSLPGTLIFDYPTVAALVTYLTSCNITIPTGSPQADAAITHPTSDNQVNVSGVSAHGAAVSISSSQQMRLVQAPRAVAISNSPRAICNSPGAIALVATAHRIPGGGISTPANPSTWDTTSDRVTTVPLDRWKIDEPAPGNSAELNQPFGAFLHGADEFDAAAFHLSAAEATLMDPQQRLLLECFAEAWASHTPDCTPQQGTSLQSGSTPHTVAASSLNSSASYVSGNRQSFGVYVGVSQLEYARIAHQTGLNLNAYYATGAHLSVTAGRIAYTFGFKGPAMAGKT